MILRFSTRSFAMSSATEGVSEAVEGVLSRVKLAAERGNRDILVGRLNCILVKRLMQKCRIACSVPDG